MRHTEPLALEIAPPLATCYPTHSHPRQMEEDVDHLLLLQGRLEHLLGVAEHSESVVALAHLELPEPVLERRLLQRLQRNYAPGTVSLSTRIC